MNRRVPEIHPPTPDQARRYQAWFDNARRLRDLLGELEARSLRAFEDAEG